MIGMAVRRPIAMAMVYLTVALLGVAALRNIPLELLPDTDLPRLTVRASWPGASPELTEAFLTAPLEAVIQQVQGVEDINSQSTEGSAAISVSFQRDTDMQFARLELSERLAALEGQLPVGSRPPAVEPYVPEAFREQRSPVLLYTVHGPHTLEWLRERVEDVIEPELLQLEGVGRLVVYGGRARILQVELDENRIRALGLSLAEVAGRIQAMDIVREAGRVDTRLGVQRTLTIRQRPESADEIGTLPLLTDHGRIVRVRDVARVYETYEDATEYHRINGQPAVSLLVFKTPGVNTVAMAEAVRARVAGLAPALGSGIHVRLDRAMSAEVREQLTDLRSRALLSALIVLLVLLLFLRSLGAATVVFATVVFAALITVNVMYFAGYTLNLLTLMGLAMGFGLVVDNAIVVLENIYRRRRLGEAAPAAAEHGAREVLLAVIAATGTTVIVLVPFVYLQGELRIYYVPLGLVVGIALTASMLVAFTFIPALAARLLAGLPPLSAAAAARRPVPARLYGGLVHSTLRWPRLTVAVTVVLLAGSYLLFHKYVNRGVLWGWGGEQSSYITINISQPRGEELERTDELARFFEDRLRELPEVSQYTTTVMAQGANIRVEFPDSLENTNVPVAVKDLLYQYSIGFGGAEVRVYGYGPSFYGGGGAAPNYTIKILGYNYETTREIAEGIARQLQRFSRIRDVDTNSSGFGFARDRATELVLDLDRARLALHALSAQDVVRQVSAAVQGRASTSLLQVGGEEMQLSVKLAGFRYMDSHQLLETLIPAPGGASVR
ncbi:MAG: efflux RND transporter permease subunit, partial [Gemmatimonadetes bacterium]|nr:efflux RND transporter permease subunit [Gemmatimonadota bacterium]